MLTAARQALCLFLKDCHRRASCLGGPGLPWQSARGNMVTGLRRPAWTSVKPSGVRAGFTSRGATYGVCSPHCPHRSEPQGPGRRPAPAPKPALPWTDGPAPVRRCPRKPCLPRRGGCGEWQGEPRQACRGDGRAQFLLNFSRTVELVCSNSHCWVGEEGLQVFMKILWSLSLQSMQLPLTGWYRVRSCKTQRSSARQRWGHKPTAAAGTAMRQEAVTGRGSQTCVACLLSIQ